MYKLIALDMDGTLLNEHGQVSEENSKWIRRALEEGVLVCLSTGRGLQSVQSYVEELELNTPMVLVNGSEIWEKPGSLWMRHTLPSDRIRELRDLALAFEVWHWGYTTEGVFNSDKWAERPIDEYRWMKFGYLTERDDARKAIKDTIEASGRYEVTNSHPHNLEVNPKGVSKAAGLQEICSRLGFTMAQVVAVGDSLNDIAMIREAGLGVAMGNAQEIVKQAADRVTHTNENDGVAAVIRAVLQGA